MNAQFFNLCSVFLPKVINESSFKYVQKAHVNAHILPFPNITKTIFVKNMFNINCPTV